MRKRDPEDISSAALSRLKAAAPDLLKKCQDLRGRQRFLHNQVIEAGGLGPEGLAEDLNAELDAAAASDGTAAGPCRTELSRLQASGKQAPADGEVPEAPAQGLGIVPSTPAASSACGTPDQSQGTLAALVAANGNDDNAKPRMTGLCKDAARPQEAMSSAKGHAPGAADSHAVAPASQLDGQHEDVVMTEAAEEGAGAASASDPQLEMMLVQLGNHWELGRPNIAEIQSELSKLVLGGTTPAPSQRQPLAETGERITAQAAGAPAKAGFEPSGTVVMHSGGHLNRAATAEAADLPDPKAADDPQQAHAEQSAEAGNDSTARQISVSRPAPDGGISHQIHDHAAAIADTHAPTSSGMTGQPKSIRSAAAERAAIAAASRAAAQARNRNGQFAAQACGVKDNERPRMVMWADHQPEKQLASYHDAASDHQNKRQRRIMWADEQPETQLASYHNAASHGEDAAVMPDTNSPASALADSADFAATAARASNSNSGHAAQACGLKDDKRQRRVMWADEQPETQLASYHAAASDHQNKRQRRVMWADEQPETQLASFHEAASDGEDVAIMLDEDLPGSALIDSAIAAAAADPDHKAESAAGQDRSGRKQQQGTLAAGHSAAEAAPGESMQQRQDHVDLSVQAEEVRAAESSAPGDQTEEHVCRVCHLPPESDIMVFKSFT